MRYWDSSALVPLILNEPQSEIISGLYKKDPSLVSWWGTAVECFSALWRKYREKILIEPDFRQARERCDRLMDQVDLVSPTSVLKERSLRLLALHPLSAADALQLASALRWTQDQTRGVGFVCLDDRLRNAALAEGFQVLP